MMISIPSDKILVSHSVVGVSLESKVEGKTSGPKVIISQYWGSSKGDGISQGRLPPFRPYMKNAIRICLLQVIQLNQVLLTQNLLTGLLLDVGESFEECAAREVKEETGLDIERIEVLNVVNHIDLGEPKATHFVTILVRAAPADPQQEPTTLEPDKCDGWDWYDWDKLPHPLFRPLEAIVRSGFNPFLPARLPNGM
ncbi:hypothetical protein Taro_044214 [Colocasia esculenta]|uniref:Nudix hydrolase domain-containing protein n=1 Tax=Colocasia esculenta TaxID=4460 RepID=A0A843WXR3_COLES|nr:hypothetical protein [Colocasia esculenta]